LADRLTGGGALGKRLAEETGTGLKMRIRNPTHKRET